MPTNRYLVWTPWSRLPTTDQWFITREAALVRAKELALTNAGLTFYVMEIIASVAGPVIEEF